MSSTSRKHRASCKCDYRSCGKHAGLRCTTIPHRFLFIDKPVGTAARDRTRTMCADVLGLISEGRLFLSSPQPRAIPKRCIRYQDKETHYALPAPGNCVHVLPPRILVEPYVLPCSVILSRKWKSCTQYTRDERVACPTPVPSHQGS